MLTKLLYAGCIFLVVLAWTPTHLAYELPLQVDPCATGETPCDPTRPWRRGNVEKSCAIPSQVERARRENPGRTILPCACKHMCDPKDPQAKDTDGRKWDAKCEARCSTSNCGCPHPCDE